MWISIENIKAQRKSEENNLTKILQKKNTKNKTNKQTKSETMRKISHPYTYTYTTSTHMQIYPNIHRYRNP